MEEVAEELQDPEHEPDKPYGHHSLPPSWNRPRSWLPDARSHSLTVTVNPFSPSLSIHSMPEICLAESPSTPPSTSSSSG